MDTEQRLEQLETEVAELREMVEKIITQPPSRQRQALATQQENR